MEEDPDEFGLQKATELDDEEFQPDFPFAGGGDESEDDDLEEEEWKATDEKGLAICTVQYEY